MILSFLNKRRFILRFATLLFLFGVVLLPQRIAFAGDISTAGYMNVEFSILPQSGASQDLFFKLDGTKFYTLDYYNPSVYQYSLSSAWDLSTASYSNVSTTTTNQFSQARSVFFKSDGTKAYFISGNTNTVYQYSLSPAWDISTLSYDSVSFSISGQDLYPNDLEFGDSGSKMYVMGFGNNTVYQYTLSTPWDLSTASSTLSYSVTTQASSPINLSLSSDGTKMRVTSGTKIYQYTLSTAWNVSTASYDSVNVSYSGQESIQGMYFKSDNSRFFLSSISNDKVYQWSLVPDITNPSVSVTSPSSGAATSSTVALVASASDDFGISGVSFYVNGVKQGSEDISSPYSINWDSTATTTITHSVFAVARDTSNNYATSTSIVFTTDNTAPTVSYFNPADNVTGVGVGAVFEIAFDETIATSTGNITLYKTSDDSIVETIDIAGAFVTASGTTALIINPSITLDGLTEYYFAIPTTGVDDSTGNSYAGITASTTWSFTTIDIAGPIVSTLSPLDEATNIGIDSNLVITFDEIVDVVSGNISIYKLSDASLIEAIDITSGQVTGTGSTILTINPTSNLLNGVAYYVQIDATAFDDTFSNSYVGISNNTTWNFTTVESVSRDTFGYSVAYGCKDEKASNYNYFVSHRQSLCDYNTVQSNIPDTTNTPQALINLINEYRTILLQAQAEGIILPPEILKLLEISPEEGFSQKEITNIKVRDLEIGMVGDDVRVLQQFLNNQGFLLAKMGPGSAGNETTFFGALTKAALTSYQIDSGVTPAVGYFGPITRGQIKKAGLSGLWW